MTFTARGKAATLLEVLASTPERVVSAAEAAEIMGVSQNNVSQAVKGSLLHGHIFRQRQGRSMSYCLTPFDQDESAEPIEFNAALWADGDLILFGLEECEGGGWKVAAEKVPMLKALLGGVAS